MTEERVRVRFFTKYDDFRVTDNPFAIPSKLGRYGLSDVINHLLELPTPQPFDFLVNDQLLRVPLNKFIATNRISTEDVVTIEYLPALSLSTEESPSTEVPSWIGSLDTSFMPFACAGCYDGQVQIIDTTSMQMCGKIAAHQHPIRDLVGWTDAESSSGPNRVLATASKDHSLKCWTLSDGAAGNSHQVTSNQIANLSGHLNSVECVDVQVMANQRVLLSGDWSGVVHGWDVTRLLSDSAPVSQDDESDRKKKKRKGGLGQTAPPAIVELAPTFTLKAHAQSVSGIQAVPEEVRAYTCSWDHSVKEWDIERQDCVATFAGPKVVTSLHFLPACASRLLLTSHADGRARLWDSRQREGATTRGAYSSDNHWIAQAKWRPGSEHVFGCVDYQGRVQLWDLRSTVPLGVSEVHSGKALCMQWVGGQDAERGGSDSDCRRVLSGGSDCALRSSLVC